MVIGCNLSYSVAESESVHEAVFMVQLGALVVAAGALSLLLGEDWGRWAALGKTDWLVFAIFTLGVLVGANVGQIGALRHLGAPLVSSLLAWRLISALVVAGLLLDEHLRSAWQVIGALLVLVTITWYLWQQRVKQSERSQPERVDG